MARVEIPLRDRGEFSYVEDAKQHPETRALMLGFHFLEKAWAAWEETAHHLSRDLGVPLCVEGCGLCCTSNVPAAWGIEVKRAVAWLLEQTPEVREGILDRIENWLVTPALELEHPLDPRDGVRAPLMGKAPPGGRTRVSGWENLICLRGRCPLLGPHMECTVYPVRPLGCRAWGVTTLAAGWCKRPTGRGETEESRMMVVTDATAQTRARVRILKEHIKGHPKLVQTALFPTALFAHFRESRLVELLPHIPTARLIGGRDVIVGHLFDEPLPEPFVLPTGVPA
jgi:Fe-S-cluster containining protein